MIVFLVFGNLTNSVCQKVSKIIGSHTARRSGATELAKRDVPIDTISKLMNHTNTLITSRYIFADTRDFEEFSHAKLSKQPTYLHRIACINYE